MNLHVLPGTDCLQEAAPFQAPNFKGKPWSGVRKNAAQMRSESARAARLLKLYEEADDEAPKQKVAAWTFNRNEC